MRLLNHKFESLELLQEFIIKNLNTPKNVLVQIFSGTKNLILLQNILEIVTQNIHNSYIIGASTSGEIIEGDITTQSIILSFAIFENTNLEIYHFNNTSYETGQNIAKNIVKKDTKAIIAFCESLKSDGESFLEGFSSIASSIPISGGNAADNDLFETVYLIKNNEILYDGIVLVLLNSSILNVSSNYILEWTPIGKEMTITKAKDNIVYEIDGIKTVDLYTKYLGHDTVEAIPASAIEFPLVKVCDGVNVARSVVACGINGSLIYAGHFNVGDKVRFAIGNLEEVINKTPLFQKNLAQYPAQGIFIYSCTVRKLFLNEHLKYEFSLINDIAPSTGFFTYGEFHHSKNKNQLLNVTTTTLSLSESDKINTNIPPRDYNSKHSMLKALSHLVNTTQHDLDENINFLNQYKMLLDNSSIVSKTDPKGIITYVNEKFCNISGYTQEELLGQSHNILRHPDNPKEFFKDMWDTIKNKQIWKGTFKNLAKDNKEYHVKSIIIPILDENGNILEYIAARTDVTELIQKDKIIKEQTIDELTGLGSRVLLLSALKDPTKTHTLVLLNLDRFSDINNYFGYEVGDAILKIFAQKLQNKVVNGSIYRISGDEFAILYENQNFDYTLLKDHIIGIVNRLENSEVNIQGINTNLSFACGVAYGQSDILYKLAHMALKATKSKNENITFYNIDNLSNQHIKNNIETISNIQDAISNDRIIPFFQGIVDNKTGKITKYESLIRLKDVSGKILSPYFFIEHSKKARLYDKLTQIMITKSFEIFGDKEFEFSINLTIQDILSTKTKKILFDNIDKYRCGNKVVLEIVESEGINNFNEVIDFIQKVKTKGCKIAIDDFGTGYSNFEYLINLKADYLKIDGSLIKNIATNKNSLLVVTTIVEFAKKLNMQTIAEFVEDETIFKIVKDLGIDYSQGYYFSIPNPQIGL